MSVVNSLHLASSSLSDDAIMNIIASLMVLPNRMCVPLIDQVKVDEMRFPLPCVCKTRFPLFNTGASIQSPTQDPSPTLVYSSNETTVLRDFLRKTVL